MHPLHPPIRRAGPEDVPQVAKLIATAFHPLDAARWLVPDEASRDKVMAGHFRILGEHALEHGLIDIIPDEAIGDRSEVRLHGGAAPAAVAVWFDRTMPLPEPEDYERRLDWATGKYAHRFRALDKLLAEHHPTEPHYHLALLAVRPRYQGRGLGSELLRHHHERLDHTAVYLEASSSRSQRLYERRGYQGQGRPFALPDGSLFYPMWRPATAQENDWLLPLL
ncbi:GNAT family N-acetyltransferase [Nonomuraea sp. NPDC052129]|uniref:GNAT family N-acetyltransferase n=1 Tax=Nonomuraea sp. NPDC052129 TaxID=3154651 RepID=UPI0034464B86